MNTFMANPANVERKWYLVDATDMPLGRLASQVADILSGKNKPDFTPHVDTGDYVIIINTDKVVLTGKKATQKMFRTHSGYIGGLKETNYGTMMATKSDEVVLKAVKGMLPKTVLGRKQATRCKIYKGAEHTQAAQQPIKVELKGARK
ncbi:MAG: 50S ribosomal protein L13 [Clostridiales bacterium]|nr:50S ribosomal protein L13 [Clostridiales bacterium]